jgi:hypothetical protein
VAIEPVTPHQMIHPDFKFRAKPHPVGLT